MIMPVFTHCGVLQMKLSETKMKQLNAIHDRCLKIVYDGEKSNEGLPSVMNTNKIHACKLIRKCIDRDICDIFKDHFTIQNHVKETINTKESLNMPKSGLNMLANLFIIQEQRSTMALKIRKITNAIEYEKASKTILVKWNTLISSKNHCQYF